MRARRVAVLADVHGNAVALAAVLDELEREQPDAIVHCGDLTWGPLPAETYELLAGRGVLFVRGNADRAVTELAERLQDPALRGDAARALAGGAARGAAARAAGGVSGNGRARGRRARRRPLLSRIAPERRGARHGRDARGVASPKRSPARAPGSIATAHTHVRYERQVLGRTFFNPGSVGMPYEGEPGAYWAMLGSPASGTRPPL